MGHYCIINGEIQPCENSSLVEVLNKESIYEVIRIYNRLPAFVEEHMCRMQQSAALTNKSIPDISIVNGALKRLISESNIDNGNVEIVFNSINNWSIRFIPHSYPTPAQYDEGVSTKLFDALRENPNAKVKLVELRERVGQFIKENNIFEAIYTHEGVISEGSRTNIFFIKNNEFFTTPLANVLPGITRLIVTEIIKNNNFILHETPIRVQQISSFDSAFLTGTSPEVLPIKTLDNQAYYTHNSYLEKLKEAYQKRVFPPSK